MYKNRLTKARQVLWLAAFVGLSLAATRVWARDADGTRMLARGQKVGTIQTDSLSPPADAVDWRYFKLKHTRAIQVVVTVTGGHATVTATLTSAMGDKLRKASTRNGKLMLRIKLHQGIYYLRLKATGAVHYRVQIR